MEKVLVNVPSANATAVLKYVYAQTTHIYFFRPYKAIYNWKLINRHPPHLDFCQQYCHILLGYNARITNFLIPYFLYFLLFFLFTVLFGWMFAVGKYKLLLPRLVKIACLKLTYIFVMNSYGPFIFKSNARWNSETTSISVFCCACFLETLQFYIKVLLYEKTQRFVNRWNKTSNNELNFFDSRIGIITMISLLPLLQS